MNDKVLCPYCNQEAEFIRSSEVLKRQHTKFIYLCRCLPDLAFVGVHEGTNIPMGELGDLETRTLRYEVHVQFDKLWNREFNWRRKFTKYHTRKNARIRAYNKLAFLLKIPKSKSHVGNLNKDQLKLTLAYLENGQLARLLFEGKKQSFSGGVNSNRSKQISKVA